jgi:dTMP kinase
VIWPALARGDWVVCDRFTDATIAYQGGGRGIPLARLAALEAWTHPDFQPDLTLLFDVPVEVGAQRLARHGALDKFELNRPRFTSGCATTCARGWPGIPRFRTIDSTQPVADVRAAIKRVIDAMSGPASAVRGAVPSPNAGA